MDKTAIRNFAIEARKILMKSAITEAGFYGITKDGCKDPVQKGNDFEVYETVAGTENRIFGDDIKRRANLVQAIKTLGFEQVIEETAYTWFNRIIAIRFMEVNNYLPTRVRVLSSETGSGTPDIITQADTVELNLTSDELEKIQTAKRENRYDDAFRMLFIKQCNELNAILPGLFEKTDDYMELLLKITYTGDGVIRMLVDSIPEDNFNVETEGQVEIIGWMYQYYNTELKDDTFAKLKKNVKITKERIPAATQLFTPDWIVRYMVENSLGRVWIEHLRAVNSSVDEKTKAEEFGWKYYLTEANQEEDVQSQLVEIRKSYKDLTPQDITCIDPCMGSGHILVYMFDVLMDIYRSEGFSERDAVFDILEKNIRGLDIDRRAYQLSYFALMMKARGYNRIFFRGHETMDGKRVQGNPKIYSIEESNTIDREQLKYFGADLDDLSKNNAINQMNGLLDSLRDAKEYGSILNIENYDWDLLRSFLHKMDDEGQSSLFGYLAYKSKTVLEKLVDIGELLSQKNYVAVTNPPYAGAGGLNSKLKTYFNRNYPNSKGDFFAVFVERTLQFVKKEGCFGLVTPDSVFYNAAYTSLRGKLLSIFNILNAIELGSDAFEVGFGTIAYVGNLLNDIPSYIGTYFDVSNETDKEDFKRYSCYYSSIKYFKQFDASKFMFKLDEVYRNIISESVKLSEVAEPRIGCQTNDNNRFIREWNEVDYTKLCFDHKQDEPFPSQKWFPMVKGGGFRKWYGNITCVVNWENDGYEIKQANIGAAGGRIVAEEFYFKEGITWTHTTYSDPLSVRYMPTGVIINVEGPAMFTSNKYKYYLMGCLNSNVSMDIFEKIVSSIHFSASEMGQFPLVEKQSEEIDRLVIENIKLAKEEWDSYERSWNFKRHPLVKDVDTIAEAFDIWESEAQHRFDKVKENEERLNSIFIEIYGLEGRISPEIPLDKVTMRKANKEDDIKSFLAYAVGCMFGRYSLDSDGIAYAGGPWSLDKYRSFVPDTDGIIPITDEEYFNDDIIKRLEDFLKIIYNPNMLEQNLEFIANALGYKSGNSRESIRTYFIKDFYKNYCSYYPSSSGKKPNYWLFSTGKQNAFKCLIYIHRYTPDMVGLIRSDYLTKTQGMIENALKNAEYAINTSSSAVDRAQATKKRDKYLKQLAEIRAYYPALSHIALQRIELDLDDGVKANYAKFQGIEVSVEGEKKQKVDLLAKI